MIDTFYRIRSLAATGIRVHLHCFEFGRKHSYELESICNSINYYTRKTGLRSGLSPLPYNVKSRDSSSLLEHLTGNDYPILFDGLHTCYFLNDEQLNNRRKFVRVHNIEHQYFRNLAKAEANLSRKVYFLSEAEKFKRFEGILDKADGLFPISSLDEDYFMSRYGKSELILPFHQFDKPANLPGSGSYVLYHGDLSVKENEKIAIYLVREVFSQLAYPSIIAGKGPSAELVSVVSGFRNISMISDPDEYHLAELIKNAHINIIPSLSCSGFRLKLLSAMFLGRHCIANLNTVLGTGLENQCLMAETTEELIEGINKLMEASFPEELINQRKSALMPFNNIRNAEKMKDVIFPQEK